MLRLLSGALAAIFAATLVPVTPVAAQSFLEGEFDAEIPTLEAVAGHRSGEQITRPDMVIAYMQALAQAAPERMRLVEYARSWEGRPLVYAVITSRDNMARIDDIQADVQRIGNGGEPVAGSVPVTWLAYSVHGNEISGVDAGLALAYHLLAAEGDELVDTILRDSVVVIDPMQNPDGRARFTSSYYQQLGIEPSGNRYTAGHDEPWPNGRTNHYLFDLNRDWFALTQPETRGKVAAIAAWQPVVLADVHEMGGDQTYFFPPSADPFNPYITDDQRRKQELLGQNMGQWMDRIGEPYYTREIFDAFYPGYGDTWPTLNGAIGMTFEQGSARGLVWNRSNGEVLTYGEGVRNQFVTSLATAETVARNAGLFLRDYAAYRREGAQGGVGTGWFVIDLADRRYNAESLARRLAHQGIAVGRVSGSASACGRTYPQGYLSVSMRQPNARLIRSLLDRDVELPADFIASQEDRRAVDLPHEIYDTTAWSVGQMSGLDVTECASASAGTPIAADEPIAAEMRGAGAFGLAVPWTDSGQIRLVAQAMRAGLVGRATDTAFTAEGRRFPRGTVVYTLSENDGSLSELESLARQIGAETVPLSSSWVQDGPNLGSNSFVRVSEPRIAILWEDGISPLSAGATRYVIEQRFGLPVAPIRTGTVARADLGEWDVIIAPDSFSLSSGVQSALRSYVRGGGVLVAYGNAVSSFASGDDALFSTNAETVLDGEPGEDGDSDGDTSAGTAIESLEDYREAIVDRSRRPDTLPGALLNTVVDEENFLASGYDDAPPVVFADGSLILTPLSLSAGTNVVRFAEPDNLIASGYVWEENRRQMAFKPYLIAERTGRGMAIGFVHDPTVRGYLDGLDLLLANAVMIAPSRVR
ncbi:M14 family metallopeptidase [Aurantiacibacter gangjinensis]|uniref:Carboxypeptidase n=1 Tax=Aurantiacibacter gangjinensis TaxID=502682 RepID=A0A0G9MP90_9SPHN|nr:M14 family metallopeptidase [Aurantiacibacter gangjinensis]APE28302.1 Secreted protein containing N-terminal Zinc-dependent carboxypeptidase related domain [Aurantiacibacter gangjinensis]KLE32542.1 carboxypeptidase [Aurantiacibacter gangjinensis]